MGAEQGRVLALETNGVERSVEAIGITPPCKIATLCPCHCSACYPWHNGHDDLTSSSHSIHL